MSTVKQIRSAKLNGHTAPHSLEAEQNVLGSLLISPAAWGEVGHILSAEDFGRPDHVAIFRAIRSLAELNTPVDTLTVTEYLRRGGEIEQAGGLAYLGSLTRETACAANVATYADIVRSDSRRRQIRTIVNGLLESEEPPDQLVQSAIAQFQGLAPTSTVSEHVSKQLQAIDFADMQPRLEDNYVIKGLLGSNSSVGLIGASGAAKTYFAVDLAVHIASNRAWRGLQVRGGLVIYVSLEGAASVINRFAACRLAGGFQGGIPIRLTPGPLNLRNPEDRRLLIDFILQAEKDHGEKCVAVFIDTVARAMPGADENASEGMGELIAGNDEVRLATNATVVLVHHLGKDASKGARGHSSFKAALDTEIEVAEEGDVRVATVTKQRDFPTGNRFAFKLVPVELGRDSDGDPVTACVVEAVDTPAVAKKPPTSQAIRDGLAALREINQPVMTLREVQEALKPVITDRRRRSDAVVWMQKNQYLTPSVGGLRLEV